MKFKNVGLAALAYVLPPEIWSSEKIENILKTVYERFRMPLGRLEAMTGIRERRFWPTVVKASFTAGLAAQMLISQHAFIQKDSIELLVHGAVCKEGLEPATAAYIHQSLGLSEKTNFFDVSNACLSFLNALIISAHMIESGQINTALVVAGENGKSLLDWTLQELTTKPLTRQEIKPYFANLTIGGGAAAAFLCRKGASYPTPWQLVGGIGLTDSSAVHLCEGKLHQGCLTMQTDSSQLLEKGVSLAKRNWELFRERLQWDSQALSRIICHQVGKQHQNLLYDALQLDKEKDFSTYETLGNIGAVSLPLTLAQSLETRAAKPGEKIALLGIGSGLSSLMIGLESTL